MDKEEDIINEINRRLKNDNLAYKVLENYHLNMIFMIDNYLENKQLMNSCLNYQGDLDRNLTKAINNYNYNDNGLVVYNSDNNKKNKIIYNSSRNLFHTSIYNYFNHIRKDYPYNTTELLTFIYIQQKKIDKLEQQIKNLKPESFYLKLLFITSSIFAFYNFIKNLY